MARNCLRIITALCTHYHRTLLLKFCWGYGSRNNRNSQTLFRTVPTPTPCGLFFPKIGVRISQPPKIQSLLSKERVKKATDFKFGRCIRRVHRNQTSKFWRKKRERIQGLPNFLSTPYYLRSGVKLRTSNFVRTFIGSIGIKAQ